MAAEVKVKIGVDDGDLKSGLADAARRFGDFARNADEAGGVSAGAAGGVSGLVSSQKWGDLVKALAGKSAAGDMSRRYDDTMRRAASALTAAGRGGLSAGKADRLAKAMEALAEAFERGREGYEAAAQAGDWKGARKAGGEFYRRREKVEDILRGRDGERSAMRALGAAAVTQKAIAAAQTGIDAYLRNLDKTSLISAAGRGDVLGYAIDERRRAAENKGALGQILGGGAGLGAGIALAGVTGGASLVIAPMLGQFLGGNAGFFDKAAAEKMQNLDAVSSVWEAQSQSALDAAARFNGANVRGFWRRNARSANEWGYSAEEGSNLAAQMAGWGMSADEASAAAGRAFKYARLSGADLGSVAAVEGAFSRWGGEGGALQNAYAGLKASGMERGQFSEFLRAMKSGLEDGISRGFVKSSKQVAEELSFVADLDGGDKTFDGERGAQIASQIRGGITNITDLTSTADAIGYRVLGEIGRQKMADGRTYFEAYGATTGSELINRQILSEGGALQEILPHLWEAAKKTSGDDYDRYAWMKEWTGQTSMTNVRKIIKALDDAGGDAQKWAKKMAALKKEGIELDARNITDKGNADFWVKAYAEDLKTTIAEFSQRGFDAKAAAWEKYADRTLEGFAEIMRKAGLDAGGVGKKSGGGKSPSEKAHEVQEKIKNAPANNYVENSGVAIAPSVPSAAALQALSDAPRVPSDWSKGIFPKKGLFKSKDQKELEKMAKQRGGSIIPQLLSTLSDEQKANLGTFRNFVALTDQSTVREFIEAMKTWNQLTAEQIALLQAAR